MTHFTGMGVARDEIHLAQLMEPFDENLEVPPYVDNTEWVEALSKCTKFLVAQGRDICGMTVLEVLNDWSGRGWRFNPEEKRFEHFSTYNPDVYLLVPLEYGKRSEADKSARYEVLRSLFRDEASGGLPDSATISRREVHLLSGVHDGTQSNQDLGTEAPLGGQAPLQSGVAGIREAAGRTIWSLCDLQQASRGSDTDPARGSRPRNGADSGASMSAVQHSTGLVRGLALRIGAGDVLPEAPEGLTWERISGALWDWYVIGGRWDGHYHRENRVTVAAAVRALEIEGGTLYGKVPPRVLIDSLGALKRGEEGWFGYTKDEYTDEEWGKLVRERLDRSAPDALVYFLDLHI